MTKRWGRNSLVLAIVFAAILSAGCGGSASAKGVQAKDIKALPADLIKGPYLGLTVTPEDIADRIKEQDANSYISAVGLYSLHRGDGRLEATLQVSKFTKKARPSDVKFQQQIANQLGGSLSQAFRMGDRNVFRGSAAKQSISSWFRGDYYFVFSVRETYATPRTLLRTMLVEVNPT